MNLYNKNSVVVGLGATGIATSLFLKERGAQVTVSEMKGEHEAAASIQKLAGRGIVIEAGGHRKETFLKADLIVVSPGVPMNIPPLRAAAERGIEIISEIELAFRHITTPIIAVTGTNGKTTTVRLLAKIFETSGKKAFLGGNVGKPLIEYVLDQHHEDYIIAEISSFQLEGIQGFKPAISVLLNLQHDHLDRYSSYEEYLQAKTRIFMNQGKREYAVLNADDPDTNALSPSIAASILYFSCEQEVPCGIYYRDHRFHYRYNNEHIHFSLDHRYLIGIHNLHNIMAAIAVSKLCGCPLQQIIQAIEKFKGLSHRIEFIKEHNGIKFYSDSKATNVGAVVRALETLDPPLILIAGGKDKGGDYEPLIPLIKKKVKALILLGEAKEKMHRILENSTPIFLVENLDQAVTQSLTLASPGDTVLLSPACSSFDMFSSYEERGNIFKSLVSAIP